MTTSVGSEPLPKATVAAIWTVAPDDSDRLHATGQNLPGTVSVVTATWTGTRHGDSQGRLLTLDHLYTYDPVLDGATADIAIDYRLRGTWYRVLAVRQDYLGTIGPVRESALERVVVRAPATRGRTVPVRVSLVMRYPEPCVNIDDAFVVRV